MESKIKIKLTTLVFAWICLTFSIFYIIGEQLYVLDSGSQLSRTSPQIREISEFQSPELELKLDFDQGISGDIERFPLFNLPPEAKDSSYLAQKENTLVFIMEATDSDDAQLIFSITNPPDHGNLGGIEPFGNKKARITYTPAHGYKGVDRFNFRVTDASGNSDTGVISLRVLPELIPWTEINVPDWPALEFYTEEDGVEPGMTVLDFALEALPDWSTVANRVILTTRHEYAYTDLYEEINERKPAGLKIIGGIKTLSAMPPPLPPLAGDTHPRYDFVNTVAWQEIASAAITISEQTGSKEVVLENEANLLFYNFDNQPIDYVAFAQALAPLAAAANNYGIEFWWWLPQTLPDFSPSDGFDQTAWTASLMEVVKNTVPNSKIITLNAARYWWYEPDEAARSLVISSMGLDNVVEDLWVVDWGPAPSPEECGWSTPQPDGAFWFCSRMYSTGEALQQLESYFPRWPGDNNTRQILAKRVAIYPQGGHDWIKIAEEFANTLPTVGLALDELINYDP